MLQPILSLLPLVYTMDVALDWSKPLDEVHRFSYNVFWFNSILVTNDSRLEILESTSQV